MSHSRSQDGTWLNPEKLRQILTGLETSPAGQYPSGFLSSFLKIYLKKNKYPHIWMIKKISFITQVCIYETERKCYVFCSTTSVLVVFVLIKVFFFFYSGHSSFYLIKNSFCSFINSHPDPLYSLYHQSSLYSFVFSPSPFDSLPGTQE